MDSFGVMPGNRALAVGMPNQTQSAMQSGTRNTAAAHMLR
jgi:hypothetical protein